MDKKQSRIRRSRRARAKIALWVSIACVCIALRVIPMRRSSPVKPVRLLLSASTLAADVKRGNQVLGQHRCGGVAVGKVIAEKAKAAGIETVAFDRSGFKYHGRVKALADSARENGLKF